MTIKANLQLFFKDKTNIVGLVLACLCAYMLFPTFFTSGINPLPKIVDNWEWLSLDPSWHVALSYAKQKGLTFGTDFAFTYGPLGWLCTRITWGENRWILLSWDLFFLLNYFLIFLITFIQSKNKILTGLLIALIVLLFPRSAGAASALILMAILVFWVRQSMDTPKPIYYLFQIVIVTLLFFVKFNTGLIVFPFFIAGLVYNFLAKKTKIIYLIGYTILPFALILLLAGPLNVALLPYIKSGFEMVSGFNDVMYSSNQIPNSRFYLFIIIALLSILLFLNSYKEFKKEYLKGAIILFLVGATFFVLYKQAFTRADEGHVIDFFIFVPFVILCNFDLHRHIKTVLLKGVLIIVLVIPLYVVAVKQQQPLALSEKFSKATYFPIFKLCTPDFGVNLTQGFQLPDNIKQKIGSKTVDVYPYNIKMLLENELNYLPRPVCQSYTAYTPYLENLNFDQYNNMDTAPEYVIYQFLTIDGRYPLFDEPKVNLALYKNYEVAEEFVFQNQKFLLLHKKSNFKPVKLEKFNEYAILLNDPFIPVKGIYYTVEIYNSITGKITSIYDHAPEIRLTIQILNGRQLNYKTSKLLLESGIFSDSFIGDTDNANEFFNEKVTADKIRYYKFTPLNPSAFNDKVRITEYKITQ